MTTLKKSLDRKTSLLWSICAIEALVALVYLLAIPTDPTNTFIGKYSAARLSIALCLFIGFISCAWFSLRIWLKPPSKGVVFSSIRLKQSQGYTFFAVLMICSVILYFLILPPSFMSGAASKRLYPLLFWIFLCGIQIAILIFIESKSKIKQAADNIYRLVQKIRVDDRIGLALLYLSFILGLVLIFFTYYNAPDEGETFLNGWLHSNGTVLYRDVFTNHFPLSYFWVSGITALFGSSVYIYRLSLLCLRILLFGIAMAMTRDKLVIGLVSLSWSLIGPLYLGNLLVYYSFNSILIMSAFFVAYAVLRGEVLFTYKVAIYVSFIIGLAFLNDPLMYLSGAIISGFLMIAGIRSGRTPKEKTLHALSPFLGIGISLTIFGVYLMITSSFDEFFQQSVLFNIQIYSKYSHIYPSLMPFIKAFFSGFDIFSSSIRTVTDPYYNLNYFELLEGWSFTAFLPRLAIITVSILCILRKMPLCGAFIYLLGCAIYARGPNFFHASTLIIFSITAASIVLIESTSAVFELLKSKPQKQPLHRYGLGGFLLLAIVVNSMFFWLNYRMTEFWIQRRSELSYENQFGHWLNDANHYFAFSCGNNEATFLYYPYNPIISYLSKLPPTTRYYNMAPWVAEVGLQESINHLDDQFAIIYVDKDNVLWGFNTNDYLSDLIQYLDLNYVEVEDKVYLSPLQYQYCYPSLEY